MDKKIAFIFEENGKVVASAFDASKTIPLSEVLKQEAVGNFLLTAILKSPNQPENETELEMLCALEDQTIHVMVPKIPIMTQINVRWNQDHAEASIVEPYASNTSMRQAGYFEHTAWLHAKQFRKGSYFYISFKGNSRDYCTTVWDDKTKKCYNVPFYNFHRSGQSCLGPGFPYNKSAFTKLLHFLNSYSSPHNTCGAECAFSIKIPESEETKGKSAVIKAIKKNHKISSQILHGSSETFPAQATIGAWMPPRCLQTPAMRKKIIGKIQPLV